MSTLRVAHDIYTVGWICALPLEAAAARALLDKDHPRLPQPTGDDNIYSLGEISGQNVVIACLPSGVYGTTSAATVAARMRFTFPSIRYNLMVGIGGGVPSLNHDIRLGDIVISHPTTKYGGVIQYDHGKTVSRGHLQQTGIMNQPPPVLLNAISQLRANEMMGCSPSIHDMVSEVLTNQVGMRSQYARPSADRDLLFKAAYDHNPAQNTTCVECDRDELIKRDPRASVEPHIYYGLIASGNQVMKHGLTRDKLANEFGIMCFEMEAAGLMNQFPCLVIRGICDYSDSHKNKQWSGYAALTAAAYTKVLLSAVPVTEPPYSTMIPSQSPLELLGTALSDPEDLHLCQVSRSAEVSIVQSERETETQSKVPRVSETQTTSGRKRERTSV
ncbi:nucleoside phosphorylase domain-containing protein [Aspergillus varians]